jgi:pimeloyl-ACP methyl ester carboxylesterase
LAVPPLEEFFDLNLGSLPQRVLIRGPARHEGLPIIIYLHGGPGHSAIPYAHASTGRLAERYVVVHYDQRGAGLSLSANIPAQTMTRERLADDLKELIAYLRARFSSEKVYLLGHSWGSILALEYVLRHGGADVAGYIAVGQVTSYERQCEDARAAMLGMEGLRPEERARLSRKGGFDRGIAVRLGGLCSKLDDADLAAIRTASPYSPDRYTAQLYDSGLAFSARYLWQGMLRDDFRLRVKALPFPILMIVGGRDLITHPADALAWLEELEAPLKRVALFPEAAHRVDVEEADGFQEAISAFISEVEGRELAER